MADEHEQKPDLTKSEQGDSNPDQINIKVKGPVSPPPLCSCLTVVPCSLFQDGSEVFFKIKKRTQMKKLMDAYCTRSGQDSAAINFLFEGERIQPTNTPDELEMAEGDVIDAMLQQVGGRA
eukprot:TRINITY_DN7331_c0_g1_i1.p1 TRINITY_DN7331_c0_g1~~TRINITY_DN7331_c0_g1_i1.p1  ORF type:complete len:121 (+),score=34.23 TRINITY_DN7331_c0_g1_i1:151-513(+)